MLPRILTTLATNEGISRGSASRQQDINPMGPFKIIAIHALFIPVSNPTMNRDSLRQGHWQPLYTKELFGITSILATQ